MNALEKIKQDVQDNYVPKGCVLKDYNKEGVYYYDLNEKVQFISYYEIRQQKYKQYRAQNA